MDWLIILFLLIYVAMGILQKAAKEAAKGTPRPPVPMPGSPPVPRPPVSVPEGEGVGETEGLSLEEAAGIAPEEGAASEEGVSMEGDLAGEEPALTPEVLREQEELEGERSEFYAEAAPLASVEGAEELLIPGEGFGVSWKDEENGEPAGRPEDGGWLWTGEDLVRAVLAAEILGPPGGRWRPFVSRAGQKVDGA